MHDMRSSTLIQYIGILGIALERIFQNHIKEKKMKANVFESRNEKKNLKENLVVDVIFCVYFSVIVSYFIVCEMGCIGNRNGMIRFFFLGMLQFLT